MVRRGGRQGGWVGMIVLLLALVIVAWLSKDALKKYGLMSGMEKVPATAQGVRGPGAGVTGVAPDVSTVAPTPIEALDKARDLQNAVRQQAAEQAKRVDDGTK